MESTRRDAFHWGIIPTKPWTWFVQQKSAIVSNMGFGEKDIFRFSTTPETRGRFLSIPVCDLQRTGKKTEITSLWEMRGLNTHMFFM